VTKPVPMPMPKSSPTPAAPDVSLAALGRLMPMFLWLGPAAEIRGAGPTLGKLCGCSDAEALGRPFAEFFTLGGSADALQAADLGALPGKRLHLALRRNPATTLRGLAVWAGASAFDGVLFNLSFGVGLAEAVRLHGLTDADFAPTELAMELLYLQEAKSAVMAELHALNARLQHAQRAAEAQALSDPLTGLANRRALERELARTAAETSRGGGDFALAHIDLDHFKQINDTLGHAAGDQVLIRVAEALRAEARRSDLVARVGGDEFVLLLRGAIEPEQVQALGERVIARLELPFTYAGAPYRISASIGVAQSRCYSPPDAEQMFLDADAALYEAKRDGRGRCIVLCPRVKAGPTPPPAG